MAHDEGQVTTFFQSAVDKSQCHIESKKLFQGNGDSHAHREGGVGTEEVIHFSIPILPSLCVTVFLISQFLLKFCSNIIKYQYHSHRFSVPTNSVWYVNLIWMLLFSFIQITCENILKRNLVSYCGITESSDLLPPPPKKWF